MLKHAGDKVDGIMTDAQLAIRHNTPRTRSLADIRVGILVILEYTFIISLLLLQ